ncbi:hypothetical protein ANANG_G00149070, partial [Anguilla anguilla]
GLLTHEEQGPLITPEQQVQFGPLSLPKIPRSSPEALQVPTPKKQERAHQSRPNQHRACRPRGTAGVYTAKDPKTQPASALDSKRENTARIPSLNIPPKPASGASSERGLYHVIEFPNAARRKIPEPMMKAAFFRESQSPPVASCRVRERTGLESARQHRNGDLRATSTGDCTDESGGAQTKGHGVSNSNPSKGFCQPVTREKSNRTSQT